jgi:hypothetical protein
VHEWGAVASAPDCIAVHPSVRVRSVREFLAPAGEITMLPDDSEVHLKPGDVAIQRGTNNAWSNRSGKPVKMLCILMDGHFDAELAFALKSRE